MAGLGVQFSSRFRIKGETIPAGAWGGSVCERMLRGASRSERVFDLKVLNSSLIEAEIGDNGRWLEERI